MSCGNGNANAVPPHSIGGMSYTKDEAVLKARAVGAGLEQSLVDDLIKAGMNTIAKVAFCSAYLPGNADETPMVEAFKKAIGRNPDLGELASFRLLFHECYAIVSQEMKSLVEKTADATEVRRLTNVERADRYDKQVKRLCGLTIKGHVEPSDSLVDLACTQYDNNRLSYISWEKSTSRLDEQERDMKKDPMLTLDIGSGKLKLEKKNCDVVADVNNDLKVQQALQRRALAYDQANIIQYEQLMAWNDRLMKARLTDPPPGYCRVTYAQLERADRRLFVELNDRTRSGIQATTSGRPVELVFKDAMYDPEVLHHLQPLPLSSSSQPMRDTSKPARDQPYTSAKGKSRDKGKGKGKTMPQEMISWGCRAITNSGQPICYGFTLGLCKNKVTKGRCDKGFHVCAIPGCGGHHPAKDCPKRADQS